MAASIAAIFGISRLGIFDQPYVGKSKGPIASLAVTGNYFSPRVHTGRLAVHRGKISLETPLSQQKRQQNKTVII